MKELLFKFFLKFDRNREIFKVNNNKTILVQISIYNYTILLVIFLIAEI